MSNYKPIHSTRTAVKKSISASLVTTSVSGASALLSQVYKAPELDKTGAAGNNSTTGALFVRNSNAAIDNPWRNTIQAGHVVTNITESSRAFGKSYTVASFTTGTMTGGVAQIFITLESTDDKDVIGWAKGDSMRLYEGYTDSASVTQIHNHNNVNSIGVTVSDGLQLEYNLGAVWEF